MTSFNTFTEFFSKEQLDEVIVILDAEKIEYQVFHNEGIEQSLTFGSKFNHTYELKLHEKDFSKAEEVLAHYYEATIVDIDHEHFLNEYSDVELADMLVKKEKWTIETLTYAKILLKKRGIEFSEKEIRSGIADRDNQKREGQDLDKFLIYLFYVLGSTNIFFGYIFGSFLKDSTVELSDGTKVPKYKPEIVQHGKSIIRYATGFSIMMLVLTGIFFLLVFLGPRL